MSIPVCYRTAADITVPSSWNISVGVGDNAIPMQIKHQGANYEVQSST